MPHFQDECIQVAEEIKQNYHSDEYPDWRPLIFQTDGLQRSDLVAHYLAMDIGVVTPRKDGMNLVAKEMMVCNPSAGLVLSTGAGSEIQVEWRNGLMMQRRSLVYNGWIASGRRRL